MKSGSSPQIILLLLLLICLRGNLGSNSGVGCKESERKALLRFKQELSVFSFDSSPWPKVDINIFLSSWGEEEEKRECCEWTGIRCNNNSGHVITLDFSIFDKDDNAFQLSGNISSLVDLKHLSHLDVSYIQFSSNPSSIASLTKLQYLNLSFTGLGGEIPELGNLSSLQVLDLSHIYDSKIKYLNWVSRLSALRVLDFTSTNLSLANDWVHVVTNPPRFLSKLLLSDCDLPDTVIPTSHSLVNTSEVLRVLDLSENPLSQSIFQWLFIYNRSLVHLDLNYCSNIRGPIPNGFNNMASLSYLDLSGNKFEGIIPESFGNLISLKHLGILDNQLDGFHPNSFRNMTALTYLDVSSNQLRGFIPESFRHMSSLTYLSLIMNQLDSLDQNPFANMTAIQYLSLESNHLKGPIPEYFGNMASLGELDLRNNMLEGEIPRSIWEICTLKRFIAYNNSLSGELHFAQPDSSMSCANFSLEYLNLNQNKIFGSLPNFTLYPSLIELYLSFNQLNGISKSIGQLSKLETLDISENSIQGVISEAHFVNLSSLHTLDLSANSNLAVIISSDWIPPFQLEYIRLGACKLGPHFPKWLETQKDLYELNISNSGISDSIPDWLWDINSDKSLIDLSNNELRGNIHNVNRTGTGGLNLDLSSNQLQGPIPSFLFRMNAINLFNNSFSGLNSLCNFTGSMPLIFLDVSFNQLSGELPDCWSQATSLRILILANNNLSGNIPFSIGFLTSINILHLGNNKLTEELPSSMMNCTALTIFDVGENKLSGPIPGWMGTSLERLMIISLRSNHFNGSMPSELCHLMELQLLDLSSNDLSGEIPTCLGNITSMKEIRSEKVIDSTHTRGVPLSEGDIFSPYSRGVPFAFNDEKIVLVWKGDISEFRNMGLLKSIDFSSNKLTGEIPRDIMNLVGLFSLNLSRNNISGHIPKEIGQLKFLDVLDLSNNHIFGQIPSSLSQVDRLSTLDLSRNNLSGKIPASTQLQTRDASAFMANPQLCGDPLLKKCPNEEPPIIPNGATKDGDRDGFLTKGFYISLAIGVVVGFWGVCGTLIFNKSLRYAYLKLLDDTGDWLYVTKEVHKRRLLRLIQT